jgi:hypothetical protein
MILIVFKRLKDTTLGGTVFWYNSGSWVLKACQPLAGSHKLINFGV